METSKSALTQQFADGPLAELYARAPIGYTYVLLASGKRGIAPDEQSAKSVRKLFTKYATGSYTLRQLEEWARETTVTSPKSGRPLNKVSILGILANPIYVGDLVWGGKTYKGSHKPLISRELWKKVRSIMKTRLKSKPDC